MPHATEKAQEHYKDWPNAQGFDVRHEELSPKQLDIVGTIPTYAAGVLFRNGLGPREVDTELGTTFRVNHWFDYFSQVHRFEIHAPTAEHPQVRVSHNSRLTCDGLVKRIQQEGKQAGHSFAAKYDPCMSLFQKLQSFFNPAPPEGPTDVDVCVSLSVNFPGLSPEGEPQQSAHPPGKIATLVNKSDNQFLQSLDPETLEPIGMAKQATLHPELNGPVSAAHAATCPRTGDVYNFNLNFGRQGSYKVFHVSAATGKTSILASIQAPAAYIHSFFLTEKHVVLCVWNSFFSAGGAMLLWTKNYLDAIANYDEMKPAQWFVIDRTPPEEGGRGLVATYNSRPFFAFHTINAYEEPNLQDPTQVDIVADVCIYDSLDVLKRFYIDNLMSNSASALPYCDPANTSARDYYQRFRLPRITAGSADVAKDVQAEYTGEKGLAPELPAMNPSCKGRKHRYVYGVTDTGKSTFFDGLVKFDTRTKESIIWSEHAQTAGEPIFVADPESEDEDGGVLLNVVLDGSRGDSYLMVLDAQTMKEVGRARVGGIVGFGFHGTHVSNKL